MSRATNILVTGASGYLGHFLVNRLVESEHFIVHCGTFRQGEAAVPTQTHGNCRAVIMDGTDDASVLAAVRSCTPDVVVNCMAIASPEDCEKDPAYARKLNVPTGLLSAMTEHCPSALLVHLSTDMVYGHNTDAPHAETAACRPCNVYGETKLEAEALIASQWPCHVILRASAIYGPPPQGRACTKLKQGSFLQFVRARALPADWCRLPVARQGGPRSLAETGSKSPASGVFVDAPSLSSFRVSVVGFLHVYRSSFPHRLARRQVLSVLEKQKPEIFFREEVRSFVDVFDVVDTIAFFIARHLQEQATTTETAEGAATPSSANADSIDRGGGGSDGVGGGGAPELAADEKMDKKSPFGQVYNMGGAGGWTRMQFALTAATMLHKSPACLVCRVTGVGCGWDACGRGRWPEGRFPLCLWVSPSRGSARAHFNSHAGRLR
jgi:hypothetical protein